MSTVSRRQLARYAADQLLAGKSLAALSRRLAAVLITNKRPGDAELLAEDIAREIEARGKFANATLTTAHRLQPKLRQQLLAAVRRAAKVESAELEVVEDKSVLGGLRIETAIHSWDETVVRRLNQLKGIN